LVREVIGSLSLWFRTESKEVGGDPKYPAFLENRPKWGGDPILVPVVKCL